MWEVLKKSMKNFCLPSTDVIRHVALIKCVKLPRVRASLSRHSNCYIALKLPVGAMLACHRLFPPPGVANSTSITLINLAGVRNGDPDCFARVKINAPFLSCFAHTPLPFLFLVQHIAFLPILTG